VRKGDVDVLVVNRWWRSKGVESSVEPWKADGAGDFTAVAGVVMVLDVLCVLELEPFVCAEEAK